MKDECEIHGDNQGCVMVRNGSLIIGSAHHDRYDIQFVTDSFSAMHPTVWCVSFPIPDHILKRMDSLDVPYKCVYFRSALNCICGGYHECYGVSIARMIHLKLNPEPGIYIRPIKTIMKLAQRSKTCVYVH